MSSPLPDNIVPQAGGGASAPPAPPIRFVAVPGSHITDADAEFVGPIFLSLEQQKGRLTPPDLLAEATPPESPLHRYFEWDNVKAAHEYRLGQARHLIASVLVVSAIGASKCFYNIQSNDAGRTYMNATDILSDAHLRKQVAERARNELVSWILRYRPFTELAPLAQTINAMLEATAPKPV